MLYPYEYTIGGETSKVNLWSMEYVDYKDADHSVKTIYDPCPAGFKIPEEKAFTGFTTTGKKSNGQKEFNEHTKNAPICQQWRQKFQEMGFKVSKLKR